MFRNRIREKEIHHAFAKEFGDYFRVECGLQESEDGGNELEIIYRVFIRSTNQHIMDYFYEIGQQVNIASITEDLCWFKERAERKMTPEEQPKKRILKTKIFFIPTSCKFQAQLNEFLNDLSTGKISGNPVVKEIQPVSIREDVDAGIFVWSTMVIYEVDAE